MTIIDETNIKDHFILFMKKGELTHITKFTTDKEIEEIKKAIEKIKDTNKSPALIITGLENKNLIKVSTVLTTKFLVIQL